MAIKKLAEGIASGVSVLAQLSLNELNSYEEKRYQYFNELQERDLSAKDALDKAGKLIGNVGVEVYQAYLPLLKEIYTPVEYEQKKFNCSQRIRFFEITKWVNDKEEKSIDKLANIYQSVNREEISIALIFDRKISGCRIYVAVANTGIKGHPSEVKGMVERVMSAFNGNFPGVELAGEYQQGVPNCLQNNRENASVAIVSNLPSEKSEDFIGQSMEKLLDGFVPQEEREEYTIILLGEPARDLQDRKTQLFDAYTCLSPYASWQKNVSYNEGESGSTTKSVTGNGGIGIGSHDSPVHGNFGLSLSRSATRSLQTGITYGTSQNYTNYAVKHTLELLEQKMKRLEQCSAMGMWNFAAYVISEDFTTTENVANMYLSLTEGNESYMSESALNIWSHEKKKDIQALYSALSCLQHPVFVKNKYEDEEKEKQWDLYPDIVDATVSLSGSEMAYSLNFPQKSVSGLPVLESVSFGREIHKLGNDTTDQTINIGNIFHMRKKEENLLVNLDIPSLSSHAFITGSTGTGKSNAIYQILDKLHTYGCKYMVIEPAKGEYKDVFGGLEEVEVYGTNPMKTEKILQINPFSFSEEIHVLEHIDRLVEILNACWPMYAAMPAVLKDAIEKSYEKYGWDMRRSVCEPRDFPTFADLLEELPQILDDSLFSGDTKGDYAGALVTRVKSMTNGINGLVLCPEREISDEELFERNVIVDISRIGSVETKSLLMGILIMKLQEFRMQQAQNGEVNPNQGLKHITVLEEAHNLLRKTSVSQSQEGANLQEKSVEMITNAVAEMRTYGEGFMIADQAPGMLDEAVIRNTNTKIILRLPDGEDRELVGKAIALTDNQIQEIAKLPRGVAVVYQNDWVEAVLCQFEAFPEEKQKKYKFDPEKLQETQKESLAKKFFDLLYQNTDVQRVEENDIYAIKKWVNGLKVNPYTKQLLYDCIEGKVLEDTDRKQVLYNLYGGKEIARKLEMTFDEKNAVMVAEKMINQRFDLYNQEIARRICRDIVECICMQMETGMIVERFRNYKWEAVR